MTFYCDKCGFKLLEDQNFCPKCGNRIKRETYSFVDKDAFGEDANDGYDDRDRDEGYRQTDSDVIVSITKVFLIITCVLCSFAIIPLLWCIPMTVHYYKTIEQDERLSVSFKVCALIFMGIIPGVLMLIDPDH